MDYNRFVPRRPLQPHTLWIVEQLPKYTQARPCFEIYILIGYRSSSSSAAAVYFTRAGGRRDHLPGDGPLAVVQSPILSGGLPSLGMRGDGGEVRPHLEWPLTTQLDVIITSSLHHNDLTMAS